MNCDDLRAAVAVGRAGQRATEASPTGEPTLYVATWDRNGLKWQELWEESNGHGGLQTCGPNPDTYLLI